MKFKQFIDNGTIFALIERVDPGLSSYLSIQSSKKFQSGETEQRPNGLLHIRITRIFINFFVIYFSISMPRFRRTKESN